MALKTNITVDAHIDIPWKFHKWGVFNLQDNNRGIKSATDFPRMRQGGLDSAFFALYLSDPVQDQLGPKESQRMLELQLLRVSTQDGASVVSSSKQCVSAMKLGLTPIFLGLEGGRLLQCSPEILTGWAWVGVRYITLTHNRNTSWADSATDQPCHNGITDVGVKLIKIMNDLNVFVDVSHVSEASSFKAIEVSRKAVLATHSGCRKLCDNPRNLSNNLIKAIGESGGVIGVPFVQKFVGEYHVADHIDHIVSLVGVDHVGIGSDLDGAVLIDEASNVTKWSPYLIGGLSRRGYSDDDVHKILGGNWLRIME